VKCEQCVRERGSEPPRSERTRSCDVSFGCRFCVPSIVCRADRAVVIRTTRSFSFQKADMKPAADRGPNDAHRATPRAAPSSARAPAHRQDTRTTRPRAPPRTAACISYTQSLVLMHRTSQAVNVTCLSASTLRLSPRLHTHQWKSAVRPATEALVVLVISPSVSPKLTPGLPVVIIRVRPVHPRLLLDRGAMRRDTSDVQTEDRDRRGGCLASDRLNERRP
jgi:hypothetical protein